MRLNIDNLKVNPYYLVRVTEDLDNTIRFDGVVVRKVATCEITGLL